MRVRAKRESVQMKESAETGSVREGEIVGRSRRAETEIDESEGEGQKKLSLSLVFL